MTDEQGDGPDDFDDDPQDVKTRGFRKFLHRAKKIKPDEEARAKAEAEARAEAEALRMQEVEDDEAGPDVSLHLGGDARAYVVAGNRRVELSGETIFAAALGPPGPFSVGVVGMDAAGNNADALCHAHLWFSIMEYLVKAPDLPLYIRAIASAIVRDVGRVLEHEKVEELSAELKKFPLDATSMENVGSAIQRVIAGSAKSSDARSDLAWSMLNRAWRAGQGHGSS